ncbi:MAG: hypothetical protein IJU77_02640 [Butyrivibrio sp.]|nr:hypothetical protein [Butyrivibrio sp.]
MDIMNIFDGCIDLAKEKIDFVVDFWDGLDDGKKKLFLGVVVGTIAVVAIAAIAYNLGKASGLKLAYDEEDF